MKVISPFYSQEMEVGSCGHRNVLSNLKNNMIMEQTEVSQTRKDVSLIEFGPADKCNASEYHRPCCSNNFPKFISASSF